MSLVYGHLRNFNDLYIFNILESPNCKKKNSYIFGGDTLPPPQLPSLFDP